MAKNVLLISPQLIKDRSPISDNIDDKQLVYAIKVTQDIQLEPILGTTFYQGLQDRIENGNLTSCEETLINDFIHDVLIHYTLGELATSNSIKMWNKGTFQKQSDNAIVPTINQTMQIGEFYKNKGEWYAQRLINYLRENELDYDEYRNWRNGLDVINPSLMSYSTSIYLGDNGNGSCESKGEFSKYYQGNNFRNP
jgi:hypothetical protein